MTQELRGALIALVMAGIVFAVAAAIAQPMTIFHWATVRLQTPGWKLGWAASTLGRRLFL
jgi:hypothetical protein